MTMSGEKIACPAVHYLGETYPGDKGHLEIILEIIKTFKLPNGEYEDPEGAERGFLTTTGRFVSRDEAFELARTHGQVRAGSMSESAGALFSQDLVRAW